MADIAKRIGSSTTPWWRRIQKLEEDGVIVSWVAVLEPTPVNAAATAFLKNEALIELMFTFKLDKGMKKTAAGVSCSSSELDKNNGFCNRQAHSTYIG